MNIDIFVMSRIISNIFRYNKSIISQSYIKSYKSTSLICSGYNFINLRYNCNIMNDDNNININSIIDKPNPDIVKQALLESILSNGKYK